MWAQHRLGSACLFAQSDQSLHLLYEEVRGLIYPESACSKDLKAITDRMIRVLALAHVTGLGAKSENLSSVALPGRRNSIYTMCWVYVYGAKKTMPC